jgi:hypothetical protein
MGIIRKFFTHEDHYNIHKLLGITSFVHFIYRFALIYKNGVAGFNNTNVYYVVLLHGVLSISSLMFKIPSNRVKKQPMIYPEFRLHSILFALRSLLVMLFHNNSLVRVFIVIGTLIGADIVTFFLKKDTTMRGMPFSDKVPIWFRKNLNTFYSVSQVMATMNTMRSPSIDSSFVILFPIQIAAFLMTCVRKGLIGADGWHILYTVSLLLNYVRGLYCSNGDWWGMINYCSVVFLFCLLRFKFNINKYILWIAVIYLYK